MVMPDSGTRICIVWKGGQVKRALVIRTNTDSKSLILSLPDARDLLLVSDQAASVLLARFPTLVSPYIHLPPRQDEQFLRRAGFAYTRPRVKIDLSFPFWLMVTW